MHHNDDLWGIAAQWCTVGLALVSSVASQKKVQISAGTFLFLTCRVLQSLLIQSKENQFKINPVTYLHYIIIICTSFTK